jgi:hypothetical protein
MLVSVIAMEEIGSTFLDWSLHFLSGKKKYYHFKKKRWRDLTEDPLLYGTAHKHEVNHIHGVDSHFDFLRENFQIYNSLGELHSVRINYKDDLEAQKNFVLDADCEKLFLHKKILLYSKEHFPHFLARKELAEERKSFFGDKLKRNVFLKEKILKFFPNEQNLQKKINNNGALREFIRLAVLPNLTKIDYDVLNNFLMKTKEILHINYGDVICDPNGTVEKIFQFLQLPLDETKLIHWKRIHDNWKKELFPVFLYQQDFNRICHHIINGLPLDLDQYNLDLLQEARVVDVLKKVHKIKLRVSSLDFFPSCASELTRFCSKKNS